ADVREIIGAVEAIEVEMVHGPVRSRVAMHERVGRTRHGIAHACATADSLHERRLAGADVARHTDYERRPRRGAKRFAPADELLPRERQPALRGERREDVMMRDGHQRGARMACRPPGRRTLPLFRAFNSKIWSRNAAAPS